MEPYYQDDYVTLYLGDAHDILPVIDTRHVDLLLADPPYGIHWRTRYNRCKADDKIKGLIRNDHIPIHGDQTPFDPTPYLGYPYVILWGANCFSQHLPLGAWLVWDKRFPSGNSFFPSDAEAAWMKGGHGVRIYSQIWQGVCRGRRHHSEDLCLNPAQKPVALGMWCIQQAPKAKTILDPYAGSGAFLIAAKEMGRRAIGCEIHEPYAQHAAQRLQHTPPGFL